MIARPLTVLLFGAIIAVAQSAASLPARSDIETFCKKSESVKYASCTLFSKLCTYPTMKYCSTAAILDSLCNYDNPLDASSLCQSYTSACASDRTLCTDKVWTGWSNSSLVQNQIHRMCKVHSMEGCDKCAFSSSTSVNTPANQLATCDSLSVYASMCNSMSDMSMCSTPWKSGCTSDPSTLYTQFPQYCTKEAYGDNIPVKDNSLLVSQGVDELQIPPMRMYFHHDINDLLLFKSWVTASDGTFAAATIGSFLFSIFFFGFQAARKTASVRINKALVDLQHDGFSTRRELYIALRAVFAMIELGLSYLLMLIVMSFNIVWFIAILAGSFVGNYIFNRKGASSKTSPKSPSNFSDETINQPTCC